MALGAQPEAIVRGPFEGRNAESIQRNFERVFRKLSGDLTGLPIDPAHGDLAYWDENEGAWISLPVGSADQLLAVGSSLIPEWQSIETSADRMGLNIQGQWGYVAGNGNFFGIGCPNGTRAGTIAHDPQTDTMYYSFTTTAVIGNVASANSGASDNLVRPDQDFDCTIVLRTSADLTSQRIWAGLTQTSFGNNDDAGGTSHYAAFRYSTVAGDGGWVGVTRDGTTQSVTAAVAGVAASTRYKLRIRKSGSTIYFSVNDGTEVAKTTNLPGSTTSLRLSISIATQVASQRSISIARVYCTYGEQIQTGTGASVGLPGPSGGSLIYGGNNSEYAALAIGASGTVLRSSGTAPAWSTDGTGLDVSASKLTTGTVPDARLSSNVPLKPNAETVAGVWDFSNGLKERGRTAKIGEWTDVAFNAGDFTGNGLMTWTVDAGDVLTFAYTVIGKTMIVVFALGTTSVGGTPNTDLQIKIPGGFSASKTIVGGTLRCSDNGSAGELGVCVIAAAGTNILLRRSSAITAPNWTASANNTTVQGIVQIPLS